MKGLYVALSGAIAQERKLDILTNNLSNASTLGFKKQFTILHSQTADATKIPYNAINPQVADQPLPITNDDLTYSELFRTPIDFSIGTYRQTDNDLDLSIEGDAFFTIRTANNEEFYTRKGNFRLNGNNELVTVDGDYVMQQGSKAPIVINDSNFTINANGDININGTTMAKLQMSYFENKDSLEKVGFSYFKQTRPDIKPETANNFQVQQGSLEESNVEPINEMAEMIKAQRAYEMFQKSMQADDEATSRLIALTLA